MSDPTPPRSRAGASVDRGVTTVLRYSLFLVIVAILVSGLFAGISGLVESQQEQAIGSQLETVGNRLATDLGTASRLVETGREGTTEPTVELTSRIPDTVAGSEYRVTIEGDGPTYTLTLRSVDPAVETSVVVRSSNESVGIDGSVSGGRVRIVYDSSRQTVVMRNG